MDFSSDSKSASKSLGSFASIAVVSGSMLGIGIFIGPPQMAGEITSLNWFIALWIGGGLMALCGALSLAELGAMMPSAGGDYPYLCKAYRPGIGFAAGWLQLLAIFPGSLATMAVATATYQFPAVMGDCYDISVSFWGITIPANLVWAILILISLTILNHIGIVVSGTVQFVVTGLPILVLLVAGILIIATGSSVEVAPTHQALSPISPGLGNLAAAYLPVYFAFSGWYAVLFIGSEVKDPHKTLPLSIIVGNLIVMFLYIVLVVVFLSVLSFGELAKVGEAGTATAERLFGPTGRLYVTGFIILAMLGCINGTIMTGSRIAYSMGMNRDCPAVATRVHKKSKTPVVGLWAQTGLGIVLVFLGKAEDLLKYTTSAMLITGSLTVFSVVIFRKRMPSLARPYRTIMYPVTPLLYIASSLIVLAVLISQGDPSVLIVLGWFTLMLLVHRFFIKH